MADGPRTHHDHDEALAVATELHAGGDSARALELLPDLVAARPDDLAVRLLLARCLTTAGSPAVARAAAEAAVAVDPTSWEAQVLLSRAAVATDPETAAIAADQAVLLAPGEPDAIRAQAAARTAQAAGSESEGTTHRAGGGLAALGKRSAPTVTERPERPDLLELPEPEHRLSPRLPAALDPLLTSSPPPPAGDAADPPSLAKSPAPTTPPFLAAPPTLPASPTVAPPSTPSTAPAIDPSVLALSEEPRAHREAPLPVSLGGAGLAGAQPTADAKEIGGARMAVRVLGLVTWLVLGLRVGLFGVGGPVGIGLFLLTLAAAAYGVSKLRTI